MKELTESQVNDIKEKLMKFKNELIRKNKINNRIKKDLNNYNSSAVYNGINDIRYLFNEYEDEDENIRYLFNENENEDEESPFKSIIQDIRIKFSKNGNKLIKKGLYYVEMKKLTESQIKNTKEKLIKFKNELIRRNKIKKDNDIYNAWYYFSITYNGIKDIRYLFNEDEDDDVKDISYLFNEDEDKITYKESPFKSIIVDIRNKLSKKRSLLC